MRNATIRWFNAQKGYGFLADSETGKNVFVHYSQIQIDGFKSLNENDFVEYEVGIGNNGRQQAVNVIPVLTTKMIEDALKEDGLYIQTIKNGGTTKYQVVDGNNVLQTDKSGMSFMDLAAYAGFEIVEKTE